MNYAVIGAGYGDEGKGLITDYLVRKHHADTVVRFNGGAQAGHTVVDGARRHVFSHIGAGTLAGATTHLSSEFLVNFHRLREEMMQLKSMGINPTVRLHPKACVTTIFDILINRMVEDSRGDQRHGSCGLGINETIVRSEEFALKVEDCRRLNLLSHALFEIKRKWVPRRLKEFGILTVENLEVFDSIDVMELAYFYRSMERFYEPTEVHNPRNVVFEGAQGLFIDAELGVFPHVTPTKVGIGQVCAVSQEAEKSPIQPVYVMRAFFTRHGVGPLSNENEHITDAVLYDHTNAPNEYQGSLRYAPIDIGLVAQKIHQDMNRRDKNVEVLTPILAITHLDQLGQTVACYNNDIHHEIESNEFANFVEHITGFKVAFKAYGPTAEDVIDDFENTNGF